MPSQLFGAIAEVLALVYQAQGSLERKALENQRRLESKRWQKTLQGGDAFPVDEEMSPDKTGF